LTKVYGRPGEGLADQESVHIEKINLNSNSCWGRGSLGDGYSIVKYIVLLWF
jgi:hypothetical protein